MYLHTLTSGKMRSMNRIWPMALACVLGAAACRHEQVSVRGVPPSGSRAENKAGLQRADRSGPDWFPPAAWGEPLNVDFKGVVCFRGNPQRNFYGTGPIPTGPVKVLWRAPIGSNPDGHWNGVGWTGQPLIVDWPAEVRPFMNFSKPGGPRLEVIQGALDGRVHFFDADTGLPSRRSLPMPAFNPIKGTVSVDPRGYPLLFVGTGLKKPHGGFHIYSLIDFKELFWIDSADPSAPRDWGGWDSNSLVLKDTLFAPAENGYFCCAKLNTVWDAKFGKISIRPELRKIRLTKEGVENSMAVWGRYGYCADNGGQLFRIDLDHPDEFKKLFDLGDDTDSTISFDKDGTFYVGIEVDKRKNGSGTVYKIDAKSAKVLWTWSFRAGSMYGGGGANPINGGILSSAAIWPEGNLVFYTTSHDPTIGMGRLVALNRQTGKPVWTKRLRSYSWSSPIVSDGVLVACDAAGSLYILDARNGSNLISGREYFSLGANVEGSPIVFEGRIYVGVRGGATVCLGIR